MPYQHEAQGTVAALLDRYILYRGCTGDAFVNAQRLVEDEAAAGPHAARQRHRGQEAASRGMTILAQDRLPSGGQEVEPVPEGRERIAGLWRRVVTVECRRQCGHRKPRDLIMEGFLLADP